MAQFQQVMIGLYKRWVHSPKVFPFGNEYLFSHFLSVAWAE